MTSENYSMLTIKASDGYYITDKSDDVDIKQRIIATEIAIGKNDSADNYKEITAEEADELKRLQDEARKQEIERQRKSE